MTMETERPDGLLQTLIALVNEGRISVKLTIVVDGTVIKGTVVNSREYIKAMTDIFASGVQSDMDASDEGTMEALKDVTEKLFPTLSTDLMPETGKPTYLHLTDVEYILPDSIALGNTDFPIWRIRLSAIAGWTIG